MPSVVATRFCGAIAAVLVLTGCHASPPPHIQFAPPETDAARLRGDFALTDGDRGALTPETVEQLDQAQVDRRLS